MKNLGRNRRRTLITLTSIAGGLAVLLWMDSILRGYNVQMVETVTSTYTGSLQLKRTDYAASRTLDMTFDPKVADQKLQGIPILAHSDRVYFPMILSTAEESEPVLVIGVEPEGESRVTRLKSSLKQGEYLPGDDPKCTQKALYLGRTLAEKLKVGIGEKVVLLGQAADGGLANDLFRVKGIFDTKSEDFDKVHAYITLPCAQILASVQGVHERAMRIENLSADLEIEAQYAEGLKADGFQLGTWRKTVPEIAGIIRMTDALMKLITSILFSVISLGVINAMLMSIFERRKEMGVMLALGTRPSQVATLILLENLILGLAAAVVGCGLGLAVVFYHQVRGFDFSPFIGQGYSATGFFFNPLMHPVLAWQSFLKFTLIELVFVLVSGLLPAYRVSQMDPVATMKE